ncbi:unnamed protein product [Paramecium sonneborni]|uniref:Uncharacterized protein n=1 Tax=Paramecium sonneborni TaxID=65129 RepID=A0A8S1RRP8_9CILI|nr:unnamed protein product [Paramecium sonneborni]
MKKILYLAFAFVCIVEFIAFTNEILEHVIKRVKRHDIWGPTFKYKYADNKVEICGWVSQG